MKEKDSRMNVLINGELVLYGTIGMSGCLLRGKAASRSCTSRNTDKVGRDKSITLALFRGGIAIAVSAIYNLPAAWSGKDTVHRQFRHR